MSLVEPVPGEPAAVADLDTGVGHRPERALVVADFHAGIEQALRADGVSLDSRASERRERLLSLVSQTDADRVVFLGDLMHAIGDPGGAERGEIEVLLERLADRGVAATLVKGNHDGAIESWADLDVTDGAGTRLGDVGFAHGHTWPAPEVLDSEVVCVGHEHPAVRLEDEVGGSRVERVWLRGSLAPDAFADRDGAVRPGAELVVFPAFNRLVGKTWVNVPGQEFLAPFLPAGLGDGQAYLLDGTRLGPYRDV
ncbi:metallophosphoesterase [Halorussus gelatinilyticus]|uniref:Metallophosphoesterase n=1 Tax=Halorussus gelatinilyticus TaxID=2937524 RepID=A0A8U0IIJ4_9EURY|nr:metallophosphoesterase [Halorussus gelatinilyticus]UPW00515.1 metallophosphoesterase [Halorussus gelatinilyticus]